MNRRTAFFLSGALLAVGLPAAGQDVPGRPEELAFPELAFDVPDRNDYHHTVAGGVPVIVVEDHTLPLIRLDVTLRIGSFLDPADRVGLASLTATMMREGGAGERGPAELDEWIEFLGAHITISTAVTEARASLRTITPSFEQGLDILFDVLMHPRFDEGRFSDRRSQALRELGRRNDDAHDLLSREWGWLLYGADHYLGRLPTAAHLNRITTDHLRVFHRLVWRPEHMVWSVSGNVETAAILDILEARLSAWPPEDTALPPFWPPPPDIPTPAPGIYHVEKDIPQGKVRIGNLAPRWDDWDNPERASIQVMDHILGASAFTSRIMQRIRSDEGLAYGAGGRFGFNPLGPSTYTIEYQSKSPTVALAAAIALEEVHRMRDEAVSAEELELAKRSLVESFPHQFEGAEARAAIFANDVFLERDHGYWVRWREQVEAVSAAEVQAVAQKYLRPDRMVMLVVGVWEDIGPGDPEGRAKMADLLNGEVTHLPERDPLTLEAVSSPPER